MKNKIYQGDYLDCVSFPLGGIGAGMILLNGTGGLSGLSIRHKPNIASELLFTFSAICIKSDTNIAKVIEGPVPERKISSRASSWNGLCDNFAFGLPRLTNPCFTSEFPFGFVKFADDDIPLDICITGWSPFIPGDSFNSSLPVAALEYKFKNTTKNDINAVYSFNSFNFMDTVWDDTSVVQKISNGFTLYQPGSSDKPWNQGAFCARVDCQDASVNCGWFRGRPSDAMRIAWADIENGRLVQQDPPSQGKPSQGASISVPIKLAPNQEKTVRLMLSWYVPYTDYQWQEWAGGFSSGYKGKGQLTGYYEPWYAGKFEDIASVADYWNCHYDELRTKSKLFSDTFFDTNIPSGIIESIEANLTILKSPTILRQKDGRIWAYEGCVDTYGSCEGSCTHVWNYAQSMAHLFPDLERTFRQTEFNEAMSDNGHQSFRVPMPINGSFKHADAAADGQLGGIIKVYRDWRISGDMNWLSEIWIKVKKSLDFCIQHWDPDQEGIIKEPHHTTYDIEFWGPDGMCTSIYICALKAAALMGRALGQPVDIYEELYKKGQNYVDTHLWNGEYYRQNIMWQGLRSGSPLSYKSLGNVNYSPEAEQLIDKEGSKYQYGNGCLSDGVIGFWMAEAAGLGKIGNIERVTENLKSIYVYNLKHNLSSHNGLLRSGFALGKEGGLLLCSWPKGDKPSLPVSNECEIWTGIEYQVAAHCIMNGLVREGLDIVGTLRARYDGKKRNPYNEYECGYWYARAMASYSLLHAISGIRYDAVEKTLYVSPKIKGNFRCFICASTGFGTVSVIGGKVNVEIKYGKIEINDIVLQV